MPHRETSTNSRDHCPACGSPLVKLGLCDPYCGNESCGYFHQVPYTNFFSPPASTPLEQTSTADAQPQSPCTTDSAESPVAAPGDSPRCQSFALLNGGWFNCHRLAGHPGAHAESFHLAYVRWTDEPTKENR